MIICFVYFCFAVKKKKTNYELYFKSRQGNPPLWWNFDQWLFDQWECVLQGKLVLIGGLVINVNFTMWGNCKVEDMVFEHVLSFLCIQSPYHLIFPDLNKDLLTFMFSVQTKKWKRKKDGQYNQNFNVKFTFARLFFEQELWKLVMRQLDILLVYYRIHFTD